MRKIRKIESMNMTIRKIKERYIVDLIYIGSECRCEGGFMNIWGDRQDGVLVVFILVVEVCRLYCCVY